jgi:excinuclease ABC subunit C
MLLDRLREKANRLPLTPGVYIMKDKSKNIIYIGKAKVLKNRISQYFARAQKHNDKVLKMVSLVEDFDYILTDSEFEALVLECSLIKLNKPKYNILLKDDKGYHYIRISLNEAYPKIESVHRIDEDKATYLGPYTSTYSVREAVDEAVKVFKLASCNRHFPQDIGKGRPCLNYYIKQCCAPCRGKISVSEYMENVEEAIRFLKGGTQDSIRTLTQKMEEASLNLEFEKAARYRDRIESIKRISARQKVISSKIKEQDIIALAMENGSSCFEVFIVRSGRLCDRENFILDAVEPDMETSFRAEFITQYYSMRTFIPAQIALDGKFEDQEIIEKYLSQKAEKRVKIKIPQKGEQYKFVLMAKNNAIERLVQFNSRPERGEKVLEELASLLSLKEIPKRIEAYDISNTSGSNIVAGMAVFEDGKHLVGANRRFKIKTIAEQDDYAAMREVVRRSLIRRVEKQDESFGRLPDLILLDGGRGQVSAVMPVLSELGLDIPLFGMVKDDKHRTRAIAADGGEIAISATKSVFNFISSIQDEVHKVAIEYHRKVRGKTIFASLLVQAPMIGETRAKNLMKHFKTIATIKNATVEELSKAKGMNEKAANALRNWLDAFEK